MNIINLNNKPDPCHALRAMTGIFFSNPRMLFRSKSLYAVKNAELRAARPRADVGERK